MSVGKIATRVVVTAGRSESILAIARRMREFDVGSVVVVDEESRPVGIVTDRDIVIRGVAPERALADEPVTSVMTREIRTAHESTPIEQAAAMMGDAGARRLVITDDDARLVGILSMDDVVELLVEEASSIGRLLRKASPALASST